MNLDTTVMLTTTHFGPNKWTASLPKRQHATLHLSRLYRVDSAWKLGNVLHILVTTSLAPCRGHSGPSGPRSQKVEKKFTGPLGPGVKKWKKVEKRLKKSRKKVIFDSFLTFFRLFSAFFDPGAERPRELFFDFLGFRARRARMTPVRGQGGCNILGRFPF